MSNLQYISPYQSITNNTNFNYCNTQLNQNQNAIKLPYEATSKVDLRNYSSLNNAKAKPIVALKENEIVQKNAFELAELNAMKTERRLRIKQKNLIEKNDVIIKAITERLNKASDSNVREKIGLEEDIVNIISHALRFTKKNNPLKAMISNDLNEKIQMRLQKNKRASSSSSLNRSLGSLMNISVVSTGGENRYESNKFLKALGLDLQNLHPDNIHINIDYALDQISKWRLVDKSKIRNLIRMRVINEISSVEERRISSKVKKINDKYKEIKERESKEKPAKNFSIQDSRFEHENKVNKTRDDTILGNTNINNSTLLKSNITKLNITEINSSHSKILKNMPEQPKSNIATSQSKDQARKRFLIKPKKKTPKSKKKILLNSYSQAEHLLKISKANPKLSENQNLINHFENVVKTKEADTIMSKTVNKNRLMFSTKDTHPVMS